MRYITVRKDYYDCYNWADVTVDLANQVEIVRWLKKPQSDGLNKIMGLNPETMGKGLGGGEQLDHLFKLSPAILTECT